MRLRSMEVNPEVVFILGNMFVYGMWVFHWMLATLTMSKIAIFKRIRVLGKRLTDRQERKLLLIISANL